MKGKDVPGIVLSGGSAYGAYEVGVMLALLNGDSPQQAGVPLEPQIFSGTSSGGFNAAWMTSQGDLSLAETAANLKRLWLEEVTSQCGGGAIRYRGNLLEFVTPSCYTDHPDVPFRHLFEDTRFLIQDWSRRAIEFTRTQASLTRRILELVDLASIISVEPLRRILQNEFSFSGIRESELKLLIGATNWSSGTLRIFENQELTDEVGVDIIMAATAFPGLDPVYIGDEPYVDGGYVMNSPLLPVIDAGADTVHIVYLDPNPAAIPVQRLQNTIDVIDRMFVILRAAIFNRDIEVARDVNNGISLMEKPDTYSPLLAEEKSFIKVAARIGSKLQTGQLYRKLRIHRYHPSDDLGGVLGLLNFDPDQIAYLIERGYRDAAAHDCAESKCVLPN